MIETYSFYYYHDTNSYALVVKGAGVLNDSVLKSNNKTKIKAGDVVKTIGSQSIVVLEWGDNSITRLGGDTQIVIKESYVSRDLSNIKVSFNLVKGKTWNFLLSVLSNGSYFKEYIDEVEAGVRGTVFEVNRDKDYVYVKNHEVSLLNTKTSKQITVGENTPISIKTFTLLDLQNFLNSIQDGAWEKINEKLDSELVVEMKSTLLEMHKNNPVNVLVGFFSQKQSVINALNSGKDLSSVSKKIDKLSEEQKKEVYDKIFLIYQKYNFLPSSDENYEKKLYYKEALLKTSYDDKNTEILLKNSLYDINDMISSNNLKNLKDSVNLLLSNKDKLKELNINFNDYVDLSVVPDSLKQSLINSLQPLKEILNINLNFDDIKNFSDKARLKMDEFLQEKVGPLLNNFKKSE
ncbi:MAG: FecR domain-containing protein [Candidatus Gracilibacteria bacterium]|nr:FecR domain-containing protein [Candidatus Gracilibacteria bacterium]